MHTNMICALIYIHNSPCWNPGFIRRRLHDSSGQCHSGIINSTGGHHGPHRKDEILATYADARRQLSDLRVARACNPTVAVVDSSGGRNFSCKSSGKFGGQKGCGNCPTDLDAIFPVVDAAEAVALMVQSVKGATACLSCGHCGRWPKDCPYPDANGPETKTSLPPPCKDALTGNVIQLEGWRVDIETALGRTSSNLGHCSHLRTLDFAALVARRFRLWNGDTSN